MAKVSGLGRSLEKKHIHRERGKPQGTFSVLEESQIDDLINYCSANNSVMVVRSQAEGISSPQTIQQNQGTYISLPRKPKWDGMEGQAGDYQKLEEQVFYRWRAQLASLEQSNSHMIMTPFERSLGIWRELWKAVEKADVLIQVLDVRDPIFFFSQDLFKYSGEVNPNTCHLLLLNKADLLTPLQRESWRSYFSSKNLEHVFFSSFDSKESEDEMNPICTPEQLMAKIAQMMNGKRGVASFVGYPNVGKSSTINCLNGSSKAGVSSTPGKTKRIQTFEVDDFTICDCPGLVFPNMAASKGSLILSGVLSIDQMREYLPPVQLLSERIPISCIEKFYNIKIVPEHGASLAESILKAYAASRGMFTSNYGNPDMSRASRTILKDYTAGNFVYCHPPPGIDSDEFNSVSAQAREVVLLEEEIIMDRPSAGYGINDSKSLSHSKTKKHFKMNKRR